LTHGGQADLLYNIHLDLMFAVGLVNRDMATSEEAHMAEVKHIFKYVKDATDFGLLYRKGSSNLLNGHTDVDWAGNSNSQHLTAVRMGTSTVTWCSKKHPIVSLSSMEVEYCAFIKGATMCTWL
jgi:hypothetical protein